MTVFKKSISNIKKSLAQRKIANIPLTALFIKVGLLLFLVIFIPLMFPTGHSFKYTDLKIGQIAQKKIIAPFDFAVLKTKDELKKEREKAKDEIPYFFNFVDSIGLNRISKLHEFLEFIPLIPKEFTNKNISDKIIFNDSTITILQFLEIVDNKFNIKISYAVLFQIVKLSRNKREFKKITNLLMDEFSKIQSLNYINKIKSEIKNNKVTIIKKGVEENIPLKSVFDIFDIRKLVLSKFTEHNNAQILREILLLFSLPNTLYNKELTEQRQNDAIAKVPLGKAWVLEDEMIINANERVTPEIYQVLYSLEVAYDEKSAERGDLRDLFYRFSRFILTALILVLLIIYLTLSRQEIVKNNKKLLLITILIFFQVGLGALIIGPLNLPAYLIPTTISSMLFGILFDPAIGFVGTTIIGLLLGGIINMDYYFTILTIFVGLVSIFSVTNIRTRNQIFTAILYIISSYIIVVFTFGILRHQDLNEIVNIFFKFILPNAILSPVITYITLGLFERIFDITTDITLLELSDLNHPLLKKLSSKASGTFHHSIIVGNLAEAAAKLIGSNPLLARVGSYYHDIGKMNKPEYFVENQKSGINKHNSLAPNMSALILTAHVKNGLEMAEEFKLPKIIRDFIPEHHGTSLMSYFYDKALKSKDIKEVSEADYKYPGPKPKSKETAIVMLADSVEAAARTIKNPVAGRLRKLVEELVEKRFLEGELDDSEITMKDLKGIIDGFMSVLVGIYHVRVEYPSKENDKKQTNVRSKLENEKIELKNFNGFNSQDKDDNESSNPNKIS
jgi:putative nucleotidyltransferase with HDIG domain